MTPSKINALPTQRTLLKGVLVVEDETDIAELLRQHIAPLAERVFIARTCNEARVRLAIEPIELAILDLNLPDGDGLDLCRETRRRTAQPLIILLTGFIEHLFNGFPGLALALQRIDFSGDQQTPIRIGGRAAAPRWGNKPEGFIERIELGG